MSLTKQDIKARLRQGAQVDEVPADEIEEGETLAVRGLTQGELDECDAMSLRGQRMRPRGGKPADNGDADSITPPDDVELDIDIGDSAKYQKAADRHRVAYGLSVEEKWTPKDVEALPPALFRRVLEKVKELTPEEAASARSFRGDA